MNINVKIFRTILFFVLFSQSILHLQAQVNPPEIICIDNDTLVWTLPINTCGSFNAHLIYGSQDEAGPYSLIATITDPLQTSFFHEEANQMTWYYYMEGDYNCAGEMVLQSTTISSAVPEIGAIRRVTVTNGLVEIDWEESTSPQVIGYIIYRVTDIGTIPIDTVYNVTNYIDGSGIPDNDSEIYYVVALDACDNASSFGDPHFTIHLINGTNICERTIDLSWTPYRNWQNGIERQEIWVGINGVTPQLISTLSPTDSTFHIEDAIDGATYCMYVKAIENGTGEESISNLSCTTVDIIQGVESLAITNVSYNDAGNIDLFWQWNEDAEIEEYSIQKISGSSDAVEVFTFLPDDPLERENSLEDVISNSAIPYQYSLSTIDNCGDLVSIDTFVQPVYLTGVAQDNRTNSLSWTPFNLPNTNVLGYEIYEANAAFPILIGSTAQNEFSYTDAVDIQDSNQASKCYFIEATADVRLPGGGTTIVRTRSNTVCLEQSALILMPNAFAPYGENKLFKPKIIFGDVVTEYTFRIFDRWGGLIFQTTEVQEGWDGRKDGRDLPSGAYTFVVQLRQPNGQPLEEKGVMVLLR